MSKDKWPDWDVYIRDKLRCVYCGLDGMSDPRVWQQLCIDHLIASKNGGKDDFENKVVACARCNTLKGPAKLSTNESPGNASMRQPLIIEARQIISEQVRKTEELFDYQLMVQEIISGE